MCTRCTRWVHVYTSFHFPSDSQKMDPEQLSSYLCLLDLPLQLNSSPHHANLALIQSRHLMRIPYQSRYTSIPAK